MEAQPAFKNKLSIRGHQDLMFSGRFEVFLASNSSGNAKQLIHSKKKNPGQGWARKPEERQAISDKIQEELSKREQKLKIKVVVQTI